MMKKIDFVVIYKNIVCFILTILFPYLAYADNAKYIFYFIGDGMGVNQVQGTELYLGELSGKIGVNPIRFTQFPYATVATTFSACNGVTDSAAAGTALACGKKTKNGTIGKDKNNNDLNSIAVWAKQNGYRVGITTSVSVDHATPAAFYAHNGSRANHYDLGKDLYTAGFDFYAGSDFLDPINPNDTTQQSLYDIAYDKKYAIARGYDEYLKVKENVSKMILLQKRKDDYKLRSSIPYAIDRNKDDLTLCDITRAAVDFLSKDADKGFFLMVEGGKIDWACHSNDAATMFNEVLDLDSAVNIAYEFCLKHPDETLIVVTADHETGGFSLGTGINELNFKVLKNQKVSEIGFSMVLNNLRDSSGDNVKWEDVKYLLKKNFGFWDKIALTQEQESRLYTCFEKTFKNGSNKLEKSEYFQNEPLAGEAKRIINEIALAGWSTGGHSAGYVPVFAIGVGADKFQGRLDNTEIPIKIAEAAGFIYK